MIDQKKAKVAIEEVRVRGAQLIDKVREIVEEGRARRLIVKKDDRVIVEFPLTIGVTGAAAAVLFAPMFAAIGAISALVTNISVIVEKETDVTDAVVPRENGDV